MLQIVQGTKSEKADCVLLDAASPKENTDEQNKRSQKTNKQKNL